MLKTNMKAVLALLLACAAAGPAAAGGKAAMKMEKFVCDGNFFTAMVPKGWERHEGISSGRQAREFGVDLKGPKSKDGVNARISLTYFGADHARYKTMEKYMRINSKADPDFPVAGEEYGPVSVVLVANRRAQVFELKTFTFVPPHAVKPLKVTVFERHIVVPSLKGGFYVLTYHAPADIAKASLPVFEAVVAGFKPAR